jgi:hypothetical protein
VPIALRWQGPQLRRAQWRQLRPGDVLVIGNYKSPPPVQAQVPGYAWPLLPVADPALLALLADQVIVVTRHGRTSRKLLAAALDRLPTTGPRVVGVVLTMVPTRRGRSATDDGAVLRARHRAQDVQQRAERRRAG